MMLVFFKKKVSMLALGGFFLAALAPGAFAGNLILEDGAPVVPLPAAPLTQGSMPGVVQSVPAVSTDPGEWVASEMDGSVLNVLLSWAPRAGWTFRMEHWTVQNDYPIQGSERFKGDFKTAVRLLLDTTAQSALPVQPCFYSNNVLRVVPRAEFCDRVHSSKAQR